MRAGDGADGGGAAGSSHRPPPRATPSRRAVMGAGCSARHPRHGAQAGGPRAALGAVGATGVTVTAVSRIIASAPLGPSRRHYANAAAIVNTKLGPDDLLASLKSI